MYAISGMSGTNREPGRGQTAANIGALLFAYVAVLSTLLSLRALKTTYASLEVLGWEALPWTTRFLQNAGFFIWKYTAISFIFSTVVFLSVVLTLGWIRRRKGRLLASNVTATATLLGALILAIFIPRMIWYVAFWQPFFGVKTMIR